MAFDILVLLRKSFPKMTMKYARVDGGRIDGYLLIKCVLERRVDIDLLRRGSTYLVLFRTAGMIGLTKGR